MLRGLLLEEQLPSGPAPAGQLGAPGGGATPGLAAADAGLPGAGLPPLAVRRPDLSHLYEDEGSESLCLLDRGSLAHHRQAWHAQVPLASACPAPSPDRRVRRSCKITQDTHCFASSLPSRRLQRQPQLHRPPGVLSGAHPLPLPHVQCLLHQRAAAGGERQAPAVFPLLWGSLFVHVGSRSIPYKCAAIGSVSDGVLHAHTCPLITACSFWLAAGAPAWAQAPAARSRHRLPGGPPLLAQVSRCAFWVAGLAVWAAWASIAAG